MTNESKEMPTWIHQIEIFGPSDNIIEIQKQANDRLEELGQAIVDSTDLFEFQSGWIIVIKFKFRVINDE